MNIVVAPDSFKGTNTALKVAGHIEKGIHKVFPDANVVKLPVADGGEGTVDAIIQGMGGEEKTVEVTGPLGERVLATYGIMGDTAIMEMAEASGLLLISEEKRNPLLTTTYGTGELLKTILEAGFKKIIIGIGGSSTNDGGAGMAKALGYNLFRKDGTPLPFGGKGLSQIGSITTESVTPLLIDAHITIACDVTNPLLGTNGATKVYARQKKADKPMIEQLEEGMKHYANIVEDSLSGHWKDAPGAGAAGGLGFGLLAFCHAEMASGIDTILDLAGLDTLLETADLVITGEGKIDGQSINGKVPVGVATRAKKREIPVLVIAGDIGDNISEVYNYGIDSVMSTVNRAMPLKEAMEKSTELMIDAVERAMRIIRIGQKIGK